MMKYTSLDQEGRVVGLMFFGDVVNVDGVIPAPEYMNEINYYNYYYSFEQKEFKLLPEQPSRFHIFQNSQWNFERQLALSTLNNLINQKRGSDFLRPVVFDGLVFDADQTAITNIQSTLLIFQPAGQLPEGFGWRTHDNQTVPMTYAKLEGLAQAIYVRNAQIYAESWALKDSLVTKTDDELLALYESLTQPPA